MGRAPDMLVGGQLADGVRVLSRPDRKDLDWVLADGPGLDPVLVERAWNELTELANRQAAHSRSISPPG
jgi:hypothetical protein